MPTHCPRSLRPPAPRPTATRQTRPAGIRFASPASPAPPTGPTRPTRPAPARPQQPDPPPRHPPVGLRPPSHHPDCPAPPIGTTRSRRPAPSTPLPPDMLVRLPHVRLRLSAPRSYGISPIGIRPIRWPRYRPPLPGATTSQHEPPARDPPGRTTPDLSLQLPPARHPAVLPLSIRHPPGRDMSALPCAHQRHQVRLSRIPIRPWGLHASA